MFTSTTTPDSIGFMVIVLTVVLIMCMLGESNSVPLDLAEAESELVAGFITEYSSLYFSIILLTEYANMMAMITWMIMLLNGNQRSSLVMLFLVCYIRSTLNSLKFDELMINARMVFLPTLLIWLLITILL